MSPIFRLSAVPSITDTSCHLVADFTKQHYLLDKLNFLPGNLYFMSQGQISYLLQSKPIGLATVLFSV